MLSLGLIEFLDDYLSDRLTDGLKGISINQNFPVPLCPLIEVDAEGDINFSLPSGPVIVFGTVIKPQAPVLTADATTRMLEATAEPIAPVAADEAAPLTVNVALADEIKANDETTYTLQVKSNREAATNAEIEIALPQLMNVSDATVEVEDAQGKRHISLQPTTGAQGESVLRFNDRLAPGDEQRYSLRVRFLTGTQADLQLTANGKCGFDQIHDAAATG